MVSIPAATDRATTRCRSDVNRSSGVSQVASLIPQTIQQMSGGDETRRLIASTASAMRRPALPWCSSSTRLPTARRRATRRTQTSPGSRSPGPVVVESPITAMRTVGSPRCPSLPAGERSASTGRSRRRRAKSVWPARTPTPPTVSAAAVTAVRRAAVKRSVAVPTRRERSVGKASPRATRRRLRQSSPHRNHDVTSMSVTGRVGPWHTAGRLTS